MVFIRTSPFRKDPQYSRSINVPLRQPTADAACIVDAALAGLQLHQDEPDWRNDRGKDRGRLMSSQNHMNQRFGLGTVQLASVGLLGERRLWSMKQERRTPAYTTCLADMPTAKA